MSAEVFDPKEDLRIQEAGIVSRVILQNQNGGFTLFAFDEGQELSEHTTPFHALATVLDGKIQFLIGGQPFDAEAGSCVLMPAYIPHSLRALRRSTMLLAMVRA